MHYPDKAKAAAQAYFSSFGRLFGQTPNFPSGEDEHSVIDNLVLDFMEEIIETYK